MSAAQFFPFLLDRQVAQANALARGVRERIQPARHLLVGRDKTMKDWQNAILDGFKVWRQVRDANGGRIEVDLDAKSLRFLGAATPHHDGSAAATSPQSQ